MEIPWCSFEKITAKTVSEVLGQKQAIEKYFPLQHRCSDCRIHYLEKHKVTKNFSQFLSEIQRSLHNDSITFIKAVSDVTKGKTNSQQEALQDARTSPANPYTGSPCGHRWIHLLQEAEETAPPQTRRYSQELTLKAAWTFYI